MKSKEKETIAVMVGIVLLLALAPSASGANSVYSVAGYGGYNGSDMGYIMSYDSGPGSRQFLRVALSVDRPSYKIGDSTTVIVRTDGYWMSDSGWWYIVENADVDINFYYPNGTEIAGSAILNNKTNEYGMFEKKMALKLDEDHPMGRYRANATVTGPSAAAFPFNVDLSSNSVSGAYATIYFDVGGPLKVNLSDIGGRVSKDSLVGINGTIYQSNNQVFNSTFVEGLGAFSYPVNITLITPNGSTVRYSQTTTNGSYSWSYTPTEVGIYYVIVDVETRLGNQVYRNRVSMGRTFQKFLSEGDWSPTGLSFSQNPLSILTGLIASLFLIITRRKGR